MHNPSPSVKQALLYDLAVSVLYTWCVYQAYVFDAKTRTTGILVYILTYGMFTLLVRSFFGVILMNTLSGFSLFFIFTVPIIQQAGFYFDFQPYIGLAATMIVFFLQTVVAIPMMWKGRKFLSLKYQYLMSGALAAVFTLILTVIVENTRLVTY